MREPGAHSSEPQESRNFLGSPAHRRRRPLAARSTAQQKSVFTLRGPGSALLLTVSTLAMLACGNSALALDNGPPPGLITETVASRDLLREYDNSKSFGAEPVSAKSRKHVQPDGIRAGDFLILPGVGTAVTYDDNIFSSSHDATADVVSEIAPSFVIQSVLPRHVLNMAFGGRIVSFAENSDQDYIDGHAAVDGALHVDHAHTLALSASTRLTHEESNELGAPTNAAEPVPIQTSRLSLGLTRDAGRLYGTLSVAAEHADFSDVDALSGGSLEQDQRDRLSGDVQLRAGYRFSPGFEAIGKLRLLRELNAQEGHSELDQTGYEALAGVAFQTSPLLRWRLLGGYGIRTFDDTPENDSGQLLLEGGVEWLPTDRITVYGTLERAFNAVSGDGPGGYLETSADVGVDFELYNNLVLKLGAGLTDADFLDGDRRDTILTGTIGLEYFMNKNLAFTFSTQHDWRDSSDAAFDMDRTRVRVGGKLRF